jgi:hypothetical protein
MRLEWDHLLTSPGKGAERAPDDLANGKTLSGETWNTDGEFE